MYFHRLQLSFSITYTVFTDDCYLETEQRACMKKSLLIIVTAVQNAHASNWNLLQCQRVGWLILHHCVKNSVQANIEV